ncbi:MAG: MBOAT family protein, partial [Erysipelotrichaceae bacterium]|nr:MBOAT family protein [Erysipelotrichaceae bacterium]
MVTLGAAACFLAALRIRGNKPLLILSVGAIITVMLLSRLSRYKAFSGLSLFALFGLSYFGLQAISYLVDCYRGKTAASRDILLVMAYVLFFPLMYVGPINRFEQLKDSLEDYQGNLRENIPAGLYRISWGLFKKFLLASRLAVLAEPLISERVTGLPVLVILLAYSIQLYCDFSGGVDMVIGISRIMGVELSENFDHPFAAQSIREFWRRWHISLGAWFRDYVYIPLGGNRKGKLRRYVNTVITFTVSGLWHGANYLLWGLLHGLLAGSDWKLKNRFLARAVNFLLVSLLWCFFVYPDTLSALKMAGSILTSFNLQPLIELLAGHLRELMIITGGVILLFLAESRQKQPADEWKFAAACGLILLTAALGAYGVGYEVTD